MEKDIDNLEDSYLGVPTENIPELRKSYLEGLSPKRRTEVLRRWRLVKDFENGNAVGKIILDNVSVKTFSDFRDVSEEYFGNADGPCLAGLVQVFKMFKSVEGVGGEQVGN